MDQAELKKIIKDEIIQKREEGYDTEDIERRIKDLNGISSQEYYQIYNDLENCPKLEGYEYFEPTGYSEIVNEAPNGLELPALEIPSKADLYNKIYGGWLGRCVGCLLGKPVEFFSKDQIESWLKLTNAYPLENYFQSISGDHRELPSWLSERLGFIEGWTKGRRCCEDLKPGVLLGKIDGMPRDDDIDYTIMRLDILETFGLDFTCQDIAESLLYQVPYRRIWSAERMTYRNIINGIQPPMSATYMNPYREQMGALTRADMWGYISPGKPEKAAELAFRDASVTHTKNGIYGEMFVAAMISAAFATSDISLIIQNGLSRIPKQSRLSKALQDVLDWSRETDDWQVVWKNVIDHYGFYDPAHTISNAAMVLLGLLYGEGDFDKSLGITIMSGLDTDSTGATIGSIMGVINGAEAIPEKWTAPLDDHIESYVVGFGGCKITNLAERSFKLIEQLNIC